MSRIDSWHRKISTVCHFNVGNQFGTSLSTHISNLDDIGQCWIFTAYFLYHVLAAILKMADNNEVPNWFPTLKNFYRSPFSKWPPQYLTNSTLSDFNDMGINSGEHYLPTYQIWMISDKVEFLRYCGGHFENGDRYKFFNVGNQFGTSYQILMIGHHNTAQIQHCPISMTFHMWVDNDVPNWFLTSNNFYRSPFSKWPPQCA
jgi:hypothetical protein